jgi:hypothetical protein
LSAVGEKADAGQITKWIAPLRLESHKFVRALGLLACDFSPVALGFFHTEMEKCP